MDVNYEDEDEISTRKTTKNKKIIQPSQYFPFGTRKRGEGKGEQAERKNTRWNGTMKRHGLEGILNMAASGNPWWGFDVRVQEKPSTTFPPFPIFPPPRSHVSLSKTEKAHGARREEERGGKREKEKKRKGN